MTDSSLAADVDRLLAEANAFKYGDKMRLMFAAQAAAAGAQELGDFRRYAEALVHQAWGYVNLNEYEHSLTHALEALVLTRSHGFDDLEARAVGVIAVNFLKCGIWQEAVFLYQHQLAMGEQINDPSVQGMALNDLAVVKMEERDYQTALDYLLRAEALMPRDTHNGLDYAFTRLNLSFVHYYLGDFAETVAHAKKVLELALGIPSVVADAHACITLAHLGRGDLDAAWRQLAIARSVIEDADPPIFSANIEGLTAEMLERGGRDAEAVQVWERIIEEALSKQQIDYALNALEMVKKAYERLNDSDGVIRTYKRLAEDIPRLQKQGSDLRFSILKMVFAMDKAALQAELRLSQQKNAILRRLSHEFRTPLAVIQSSTDLLSQYDDKLTLEQRQARLRRITEQVQWLTVMLDDILELLRLDDEDRPDAAQLYDATFRLDDLAQAALLQLARYRVSNVGIRVSIQPEDAAVTAPRKELQTVLVHLLTNAVKFSQDVVRLSIFLDGETLTLRVSDQGIGIPPEEHAEVFKPLVRGTNLDEVTGSGLGLAIVARLVVQMGGSIDLQSGVGEGTTVTVRIPV